MSSGKQVDRISTGTNWEPLEFEEVGKTVFQSAFSTNNPLATCVRDLGTFGFTQFFVMGFP